MEVLTNYLAGDYIQKSCAAEAADWILTPYRKLFNGKDVEIHITHYQDSGREIYLQQEPSFERRCWQKPLWAIAAVAIFPLALIAALFKRYGSPSVEISGEIGSHETPLTTDNEVKGLKETFRQCNLSGTVTYWEQIPPNLNAIAKRLSGSDGWTNSRRS